MERSRKGHEHLFIATSYLLTFSGHKLAMPKAELQFELAQQRLTQHRTRAHELNTKQNDEKFIGGYEKNHQAAKN